jgi:nucleotide-binding universal stress UspA family protein
MKMIEWGSAGPSPLPALSHVLCAFDVARPTASPLRLAGLIAERFGASLTALYVDPRSAAPSVDSARDAQRLLNALPPLGRQASVAPRLSYGNPAERILEHAQLSDLLVLGSRQRSDLGWQFRDDVVRDVAAQTACATLTVHDRDVPEAIESILVPIDFSAGTSATLRWALALALRFNAKLKLLHVVSREQHTARSTDRVNVQRTSFVPHSATLELTALETHLRVLGVDVASEIIVAASTANGIESYNDQGEVDLVVMGAGPVTETRRLTRGIIATLRNRLPVPLLAVPSLELDGTHAPSRACRSRCLRCPASSSTAPMRPLVLQPHVPPRQKLRSASLLSKSVAALRRQAA